MFKNIMTIEYRMKRLGRIAGKAVDRYLKDGKLSFPEQMLLVVYSCYETSKIIDEFMSLKQKEYNWKKKTYFKNVKKKDKGNKDTGFVPKF